MNYAGFWKRLAAMLIDSIIIIPINVVIGMVLGFALVVVGFDSIQFVLNIIGLIVSWVYFALMECSRTQGTLGKMALGINSANNKTNKVETAVCKNNINPGWIDQLSNAGPNRMAM